MFRLALARARHLSTVSYPRHKGAFLKCTSEPNSEIHISFISEEEITGQPAHLQHELKANNLVVVPSASSRTLVANVGPAAKLTEDVFRGAVAKVVKHVRATKVPLSSC